MLVLLSVYEQPIFPRSPDSFPRRMNIHTEKLWENAPPPPPSPPPALFLCNIMHCAASVYSGRGHNAMWTSDINTQRDVRHHSAHWKSLTWFFKVRLYLKGRAWRDFSRSVYICLGLTWVSHWISLSTKNASPRFSCKSSYFEIRLFQHCNFGWVRF
jgi:hypothetical protein